MHSKTTVVIVIGQLGVGGGERQLYLLLRDLNKLKFDIKVVSFNPGADDYWEKPILELGIPILFIERRPSKFSRLFSLYKLIKRESPDVLLSWTLHLNFFVSLIGKWCGISLTIGSIRNDLFNPMKSDRPLHRFFGTKGPHLFIANSTKGKTDMVERLKITESKVCIIFNAIELPTEIKLTREASRANLLLPENAFLIVNVGRLEPSKNQKMLIETLVKVKDQNINAHVVFIGEGPSKSYYQQVAANLGISASVHFLGKIPMIVNYLHLFDLMCHTGLADGMPNVLLEGASQGLPLISTRVNGAEDVIIHGETGFIVEYHDVDATAGYVIDLYRDLDKRKAMGDAGRIRVLSKLFSVQTMVSKFEQIFETTRVR